MYLCARVFVRVQALMCVCLCLDAGMGWLSALAHEHGHRVMTQLTCKSLCSDTSGDTEMMTKCYTYVFAYSSLRTSVTYALSPTHTQILQDPLSDNLESKAHLDAAHSVRTCAQVTLRNPCLLQSRSLSRLPFPLPLPSPCLLPLHRPRRPSPSLPRISLLCPSLPPSLPPSFSHSHLPSVFSV